MLDDSHKTVRKCRLWVYIDDADHPFAFFDFTPTHAGDGPREFLRGYSGFLQADAYRGYDAIYDGEAIREVACRAHARRKFHDARASDPPNAHAALGLIAELYAVEDGLRQRTKLERLDSRQTHALPVLIRLRNWLKQQKTSSLPMSSIAMAIK